MIAPSAICLSQGISDLATGTDSLEKTRSVVLVIAGKSGQGRRETGL